MGGFVHAIGTFGGSKPSMHNHTLAPTHLYPDLPQPLTCTLTYIQSGLQWSKGGLDMQMGLLAAPSRACASLQALARPWATDSPKFWLSATNSPIACPRLPLDQAWPTTTSYCYSLPTTYHMLLATITCVVDTCSLLTTHTLALHLSVPTNNSPLIIRCHPHCCSSPIVVAVIVAAASVVVVAVIVDVLVVDMHCCTCPCRSGVMCHACLPGGLGPPHPCHQRRPSVGATAACPGGPCSLPGFACSLASLASDVIIALLVIR